MTEASTSDTPLRASFQVKLNGESVVIATVGQAYRFITRLNTVEWMEFQLLHEGGTRSSGRKRDDDRAGDQRGSGAFRAREVALTKTSSNRFGCATADEDGHYCFAVAL